MRERPELLIKTPNTMLQLGYTKSHRNPKSLENYERRKSKSPIEGVVTIPCSKTGEWVEFRFYNEDQRNELLRFKTLEKYECLLLAS